jgi:hypothetical protein
MVGRFGRKVGRSGKRSCLLSLIYRLGEEFSKKKEKIIYLSHVFFPSFSFQLQGVFLLKIVNLSSFCINEIKRNILLNVGQIPLKVGRTEFVCLGG